MRRTPGRFAGDDTLSDTYLRASSPAPLRACASLRSASRRGCIAGLGAIVWR